MTKTDPTRSEINAAFEGSYSDKYNMVVAKLNQLTTARTDVIRMQEMVSLQEWFFVPTVSVNSKENRTTAVRKVEVPRSVLPVYNNLLESIFEDINQRIAFYQNKLLQAEEALASVVLTPEDLIPL